MVDAAKLTAGQKIWMQSADVFEEVTVTEVTEKYIEVELPDNDVTNCELPNSKRHIRFPLDGTQCDGQDYVYNFGCRGFGLFENGWQDGPWPASPGGYLPNWELVYELPEERKSFRIVGVDVHPRR